MAKKSKITPQIDDELSGLTHYAIDNLRRTNPMMKLIGIIGVLSSIVIFISGVLVLLGFSIPKMMLSLSNIGIVVGMMLIIGSVLMFLPSFYLMQSSKHLKKYFDSPQSENLEMVIYKQKLYFKFIGLIFLIQFIIILVLFLKSFVLGML